MADDTAPITPLPGQAQLPGIDPEIRQAWK
jgi:hypothetical protein